MFKQNVMQGKGVAQHRESIRASYPEDPGSRLGRRQQEFPVLRDLSTSPLRVRTA